MITIHKDIKVDEIQHCPSFQFENQQCIEEKAVFMDLEHYIYKVPVCIGVFGASIYDKKQKTLHLTQYMIECEDDKSEIIALSYEYLKKYSEIKEYIVTFSGNNDFGVIDHLFKESKRDFHIRDSFINVDLQTEYEKENKINIGLKNLEKKFHIERSGEIITGYELAKIIRNIGMKGKKCSSQVINSILDYNEQDVVNLFKIMQKWNDNKEKKE